MEIEHIDPDGGDCSRSKAIAITAIDPQTGDVVALFNPRTQVWAEHFQWIDDGQQILGLTATGPVNVCDTYLPTIVCIS
jgi:hypothetical protein